MGFSRNEMNSLKLNKVVWGCYHLSALAGTSSCRNALGVGGTLLFKSAFSMDILTSLPWHQRWLSEGKKQERKFAATSWLQDSCKTWVGWWDSISKHLKLSSYRPSSGLSVQMREETNSAASWNFISTNPGQPNTKFQKVTFEPASKSTSKCRAHLPVCL